MLPDVMKIGGVTVWMRAAALGEALAFRSRIISGPKSAHTTQCATPTAHSVKYANWCNPVPNLSA
jgi:mandelate racemase